MFYLVFSVYLRAFLLPVLDGAAADGRQDGRLPRHAGEHADARGALRAGPGLHARRVRRAPRNLLDPSTTEGERSNFVGAPSIRRGIVGESETLT